MKRLLSAMLAFIFVVMAFASCAKLEEEGFSDSELGSDSDFSDVVMDNNSSNTDESGNNSENNETVNNNNNNNNSNNDNNNGNNNGDNSGAQTPTFNVKESTSGLKFVLNEDKLGYTLVGRGTSTAKDIVIDGHNGLPVTKIGYSAFGDDKTITSVKLGDYVEEIDDYGFSMCSALTSVTFGKGVKFLGDYSFRYCSSLTSVELGKNIETIKYGSFYNCGKLATIKAYDKIRLIEEYAFDKTEFFKNSNNWKNNVLYIGTNLIKAKSALSGTYTVADNTTCIGGLAFYGCSSVSGIVIPDSVHSIGLQAFENATSLNTITIGKGVTYIGEKAFKNTKYFNTSSKWTNNVLYSGTYLLAANPGLSGSYSVINGTKAIADMAFNDCVNVTSITIPDSVVYLGEYAFRGCEKLSNVTIGTGVKEIGIYAFKDCSTLKGINLKKTAGWTAGKIEIPTEQIANKEQAAMYLGLVYSDKVWNRA